LLFWICHFARRLLRACLLLLLSWKARSLLLLSRAKSHRQSYSLRTKTVRLVPNSSSVRPLATFADTRVTGSFQYSHAAGKTSAEEDAADIQDDAVFLLASQTKLLTAVAALQIVERGLIAFDDDVAEILPELAEQKVLTGFDEEDKPVLEERREAITFRYISPTTATRHSRCEYSLILTPTTDTSSPTQPAQPTTPPTPT
jgi:CubicO group peptidase (beta-lactamase class C family)